MARVTVSSKYQVVIPKEVREKMKIRPGHKVEIFIYNCQIEFIPVRPIKEMRGFLKGIDSTVEREEEDRV